MTTRVTGYEMLVLNTTNNKYEYKDLGAIFVVSEATRNNNIGIQYFTGNQYKDLADVFAPYEIGSKKAELTGYESNNGTYAGKDLNEIFQYERPVYIITGTGNYRTSKDASENTIITFTSNCFITFSIKKDVQYTMYGGGAGGTNGGDGYNDGAGYGGSGGGGGKIGTGTFSYDNNTTYTINVGAGGVGGQDQGSTGSESSIKKGTLVMVSALGGTKGAGGTGGKNGPNPTATTRAGGGGGRGGGDTTSGAGGRGGSATAGGQGSATNGNGGNGAPSSGAGGGGGGGGGFEQNKTGKLGGAGGSGIVILKISP